MLPYNNKEFASHLGFLINMILATKRWIEKKIGSN